MSKRCADASDLPSAPSLSLCPSCVEAIWSLILARSIRVMHEPLRDARILEDFGLDDLDGTSVDEFETAFAATKPSARGLPSTKRLCSSNSAAGGNIETAATMDLRLPGY